MQVACRSGDRSVGVQPTPKDRPRPNGTLTHSNRPALCSRLDRCTSASRPCCSCPPECFPASENSHIVLPRICMKYQNIFCRQRISNNVCITVWGRSPACCGRQASRVVSVGRPLRPSTSLLRLRGGAASRPRAGMCTRPTPSAASAD